MMWRKLGACLFRGGDDDTSRSMLFLDTVSDDMLLEILSRLPAKSVVDCKRVCRRWYSVINAPNFVETHLKRCTRQATVMQYGADNYKTAFFIDNTSTTKNTGNKIWRTKRSEYKHYTTRIVASCDGMLVLWNFYYLPIMIHNPITDEALIVNPPKNQSCCGFFLDRLMNEYKLIMFEYERNSSHPPEHRVYSTYGLRTNLSKEICTSEFRPADWMPCASHNLHNKLVCWKVTPVIGIGRHRCSECIMIYVVSTENCYVIPHPGNTCSGTHGEFGMMNLFEMENHVAFTKSRENLIHIWILEDLLGFSWIKRYVVDLRARWHNYFYIQVLNIDDDKLLLKLGEKIISYSLRSKVVRKIISLTQGQECYPECFGLNLKPSLVSPNQITRCEITTTKIVT